MYGVTYHYLQDLTLMKEQSRLDVRKYSFSQRTINVWNNLSHSVRRAAHSGSASQPLRTESRSQRLCTNGVISSTRCEHRLKLTNDMAWHVIDLYVSVRMLAIGQLVFRERIIYWGDPDLVRRSKQSRQNGGAQSTYICTAFLGVTGFIVALSVECWQW